MATLKLGSTTVLTESSGAITYNTGTIGSSVTFPAGVTINTTVYNIPRATFSHSSMPRDDTIPQRTEGGEAWSQAYTPSTSDCTLLLRGYFSMAETSNIGDDFGCAWFISDDNDALVAGASTIFGTYGSGYGHEGGVRYMEHSMASWGATEKTFSLRIHGCNSINYGKVYGDGYAIALWGAAYKSTFTVQEIAT